MTVTTMTPEAFLAMPSDPDEAEEIPQTWAPATAVADWELGPLMFMPADPMERVADALERLVALQQFPVQTVEPERDLLREEAEFMEREARRLQAVLEEIRVLVKPSTSKLANAVRAVLDPPAAVVEVPEQPEHDAPVEAWREYARQVAEVPEGTVLDAMNRAQIRTLLGISQVEDS